MHSGLLQAYNEHQEALLGYIRKRCSDDAEAEDLLQDLYIKLSDQSEQSEIKYPKAYLYRMANNLAIDFQRRRARIVDADPEVAFEQVDEASPEKQLVQEQKLAIVIAAVNELPEKTRQVFKMQRLEQRDKADVAATMGISVNMVEKHLRRAIQHCQLKLTKSEN